MPAGGNESAGTSRRPVYALDVGTTKVVALAGLPPGGETPAEVVSVGEVPSRGLRKGVVVDRDAAADTVARALERCGVPAGSRVVVGIAGSHVECARVEVTLLNRGEDLTVTQPFLERLEEEARLSATREGRQVIHVVPREYVLDGSNGVRHPLGLAARRVTLRASVVSGAVTSIQNLLYAVEDCGVEVARIVLEPLASAGVCLPERARARGAVLLDIGGGTTDLAVFEDGVMVHAAVIPIGGESFSSDVAYGMKVPFEVAERLKVRYGSALSRTIDPVAAVRLGNRYYNAHFLSEILEYRAREVFEYARDALREASVKGLLPGGVFLTGGGSLLEGMDEVCEETLGMRASKAAPRRLEGNAKALRKPQYSTAVGLLGFGPRHNEPVAEGEGATKFSFGSIVAAIKSWFRGE